MAKGGSEFTGRDWDGMRTPVNTDAPWPRPDVANERILRIQTKLHQWATDDPDRRFDDLYNLVYDPAVLVDAWTRSRATGARSAGWMGALPITSRQLWASWPSCRSCEMTSRPADSARRPGCCGDP